MRRVSAAQRVASEAAAHLIRGAASQVRIMSIRARVAWPLKKVKGEGENRRQFTTGDRDRER